MKKVLSLALALMMVLSLAAVAHAEPIEITYWSVFTGADGATMQAMVDAFNASQDEVHVTHTPMTADDLYQKIPLTVQTGTGIPSVCIVHIEARGYNLGNRRQRCVRRGRFQASGYLRLPD